MDEVGVYWLVLIHLPQVRTNFFREVEHIELCLHIQY